jgi:hypothetical protein
VQMLLLPCFTLVPSGKITAERWCFSMYSNPLIAGIACFGSLRSINAEPPWRKLKEINALP